MDGHFNAILSGHSKIDHTKFFTSHCSFYVVSSYQEWSPSPVPKTLDAITQIAGQLDINMESTVGTARESEKKRQKGRPRKAVSPEEMKRRQKAANGRERKRMTELTRLFRELKHRLPINVHIQSKKEILVQVWL